MRFASLASGSEGNALVVESGATRIMLDCGLGLKETVTRLNRLSLSPDDLSGILVTHEHEDHASGVTRFARKYDIPVWLTYGTFRADESAYSSLSKIFVLEGYQRFGIGDIEMEPFPVPHDAREPVQFVFGDGARRLGVITDLGSSTPHVESVLSGCHALVLECNHDSGMLARSAYPPTLIRRISGRLGHLDNESASKLLAKLDRSRLQHVVAAHLSQKNNTPVLAKTALCKAMGCEEEWIGVACQREGFDWRQIA
ncbi:MAG TPA: MBL fold metallo-hydrolase [Burkholderiales bacterium]|nr:MBL fold metallo-hydrolase [Burkholderiales bacterium]